MSVQDPMDTRLAELLSLPYSVETQSRIAALLNDEGEPDQQLAAEEHFETALTFVSSVSSHVKNVPMSLSHSLATAMLGKICILGMSTRELYREHEEKRLPFLDHSSIASLSRAIIEAAIMYWYLTEEVTEDEWEFRLQVMKIHDAASRVRLWKGLIPEEAESERAVLKELRDQLKAMEPFKKRKEEQRIKLRAGEVVYVNGMRSVVKSMNFEEDYYDGVYNYLSAHVHSTPISYFRDREDSFTKIFWQRTFSQYALHHAQLMMLRVGLREIRLSGLEGRFDAATLDQFRKLSIRPIGSGENIKTQI